MPISLYRLFFLCAFSLFFILSANTASANSDHPKYIFGDLDGEYPLIPGLLETDLEYARKLFDRQDNVTNKNIVMLKQEQDGSLEPYRIYLSGRFVGSVIDEKTNTSGKFPLLSQFPNTHTQGEHDRYDAINDISVSATAVTPWVKGLVQWEYSDIEYPHQEQKQIRKYYVTLGNLDKMPFYATYGKKTVNFGDFASYAPFTHSHSAHYFWAQTDEPLFEVGYVDERSMIAASIIKNDRELRVLNSPTNDDAYENFALNAYHHFYFDSDLKLKVGGGYLRGTIYDSALAHHPPGIGFNDRNWNGAMNANMTLKGESFDLMAEYTQTVDDWPATDHHVSAYTVQGRYRDTLLTRPATYSLMYSEGKQGKDGDEWDKMRQGVAGLEVEVIPHVELGAEYLYHHGFVPLILPRVTADDGVASHTVIVGAKVTF